jgi:ubiquinone/menaquinone biosynthesis C-methylase UbiE
MMEPDMTPGRDGWQLEGTAAELYERFLVPTVTRPWARDLIERAGLRPRERVLDVACGTGVVARLAASEVGEGGRVAALDVNREMLSVARSLPASVGAPIEWYEASALALPFGEAEFDVVLCQLGLQFFPDPSVAVKEMRRVLAHGGRVGVSVFAAIEHNPAAQALSDALDRQLGPGAADPKRSEHALADPNELHELFATAGFADVRIETVTLTVRFASVDEWVGIQLSATPLAALRADRGRDEVVPRVRADVSEALAAFTGNAGFAFPQRAHVALAQA